MKQYRFRLNAVAALFALGAWPVASALAAELEADAQVATLPVADVVVVSATRIGHPSFDLPASIDVIDSARIRSRGGLLTLYDKSPEDLLGPPLEDYARMLLGVPR